MEQRSRCSLRCAWLVARADSVFLWLRSLSPDSSISAPEKTKGGPRLEVAPALQSKIQRRLAMETYSDLWLQMRPAQSWEEKLPLYILNFLVTY
jgi:hypothetical protein